MSDIKHFLKNTGFVYYFLILVVLKGSNILVNALMMRDNYVIHKQSIWIQNILFLAIVVFILFYLRNVTFCTRNIAFNGILSLFYIYDCFSIRRIAISLVDFLLVTILLLIFHSKWLQEGSFFKTYRSMKLLFYFVLIACWLFSCKLIT